MMQFMFPIWHAEHYYLITINVKTPRVDIIDNSSNATIEAKYGNIPRDLVSSTSITVLVYNICKCFIIICKCK